MISQYAAPELHSDSCFGHVANAPHALNAVSVQRAEYPRYASERNVVADGFRSIESAVAHLEEIDFQGSIELDVVAFDEDGACEIAITLNWSDSVGTYRRQ
jgi:hypothetical protein